MAGDVKADQTKKAKSSSSESTDRQDKPERKETLISAITIDEELIFSDNDECEELPAGLKLVRYLVMVSVAISWICYLITALILTFVGVATKPASDPSQFFYGGCFVGTTACVVGLFGARDIHKHLVWLFLVLLLLACMLTVLSVAVTGGVVIDILESNDEQTWMGRSSDRNPGRALFHETGKVNSSGAALRSGISSRAAEARMSNFSGAPVGISSFPQGVAGRSVGDSVSGILYNRRAATLDYDYKWAQFHDKNVLRHMTVTLVVSECFAFIFGAILLTYTGETWPKPWIIDDRKHV